LAELIYESLIQNEEFNRILHEFPPKADRQDDIFLVPIPLSSNRFKNRGYKQAEILAKALGKKFGFEVFNALERVKETRSQVGLDKKKRKENIAGAFKLKNKLENSIKNKNFVLVDDVLTTGATISEAGKILKKAGANRVWAIAFARDQ